MGIATATVSAFNVATQLTSDDPQGESCFPRSTSLGSFFGNTPIVQQAGNGLSAVQRGQAAGSIYSWSSTQSPSAANANTGSESTMTVQSGTVTNAAALITTSDLIYINKPTAQAGLGMGNVRQSASNQIAVTFTNWTGSNITPTSSEAYKIISIRGMRTITATLSPAAVAANTTVEQTFTITPTAASPQGLPTGTLVQVSKPTQQAGLDIVGCRVVSNNVVGITFVNVTASPITPTAAESYTIFALGGLDAVNNFLSCQMNAGTIGAIGAGLVVSGGATTFTGILATDVPIGPAAQPTAQAAATNAAVPALSILTADTLTMYFSGIGSGATPTASLPYTQLIYRQNPAAPLLLYTPSIAPASVAANTTAEQTFTVTGLIAGTPVWVNKPTWTNGIGIAGVRVSAANTLAINFTNSTSAAITPPTETYIVGNFQVKSPGAGNCIYQTCSPTFDNLSTYVGALRSALGPAGYGLHGSS